MRVQNCGAWCLGGYWPDPNGGGAGGWAIWMVAPSWNIVPFPHSSQKTDDRFTKRVLWDHMRPPRDDRLARVGGKRHGTARVSLPNEVFDKLYAAQP